jgi:FixJ family two-component response regulator
VTINISDVFPSLTRRQREVCALLLLGYSNKRVAQVLGISHRTIENHRAAILEGTKAVSLAEVALKLCGSPELVA